MIGFFIRSGAFLAVIGAVRRMIGQKCPFDPLGSCGHDFTAYLGQFIPCSACRYVHRYGCWFYPLTAHGDLLFVLHRFRRELPKLGSHILGTLVVINLEHAQIPVANHARQVQHVQFFGQTRDGRMPAVVEGQPLDAGSFARFAE